MNLDQKVSRKDFLKTGILGIAALGIFAKSSLSVDAATVRDNLGSSGGSSSGSSGGSGGSSSGTSLVIKKATAPNNTNALWIDTSQTPRAIAKYYKDGEGWVPLASVWTD